MQYPQKLLENVSLLSLVALQRTKFLQYIIRPTTGRVGSTDMHKNHPRTYKSWFPSYMYLIRNYGELV